MEFGVEEILIFWFGALTGMGDVDTTKNGLWWKADAAADAEIIRRFGDLIMPAVEGEFGDQPAAPRDRLAQILVLDQFTRVAGRGTVAAFAGDARALKLCLDGIAIGQDKELRLIERGFFYMPMMHAEDRDVARRSVKKYAALSAEIKKLDRDGFPDSYAHAVTHAKIVAQFGRFPHRNKASGRASTEEEVRFLDDGGPSFGQ